MNVDVCTRTVMMVVVYSDQRLVARVFPWKSSITI